MRADTRLDVTVAALCTRHQFTQTPQVVIEQLRGLGTEQLVAASVVQWIGYYENRDRSTLIATGFARIATGFANPRVSGRN